MNDSLTLALSFAFVALAAHRIGRWATAARLPYITGYLAAGAVAGSFGLGLVPSEAAADLRWIDEVSLAVIAYVAGSELHLPEIRPMLATVRRFAVSILLVGFGLLAPAVWVVAGAVDGGAMASEVRLSVAILGAIVLLALSPPSTIAVIREVRARGRFTSTVLSVTVLMDVLVVMLFAAGTSVVAALLNDTGLDVGFVAVLLFDLAVAVGAGVGLGRGLARLVGTGAPRVLLALGVLASGWAVHEAAALLDTWSLQTLPFEVHLEPLLVCMVAGFTVTNLTDRRAAFDRLLHDVSPSVYVAFFALTGLGLKLDVLLAVLPAAVLLFTVRLAVLYVGTRTAASSEPTLRRWSWMSLVTQAGIALGLAREATVQFPELGASFTTLIIAVVVLNEVAGPMFLRWALERTGDARTGPDGVALLYGLDARAFGMAERLRGDGWTVVLADVDAEVVDEALLRGHDAVVVDLGALDVEAETLGSIGSIDRLVAPFIGEDEDLDVVVVASADDEANVAVARAAMATNPAARVVARVTGPTHARAYDDLDALVIDHTSAVAGLLEQAVRTPAAVRLVFPTDDSRRTVQVAVPAGWRNRQLRELRLPTDVLVVEVRRRRLSIVPDGFTRVRAGDVLTLLGTGSGVQEAATRIQAAGSPRGTDERRPDAPAAAAPSGVAGDGHPSPVRRG